MTPVPHLACCADFRGGAAIDTRRIKYNHHHSHAETLGRWSNARERTLPGRALRPQLRRSTPPTRSASYRALREKSPVAWTEAHGGYWVLAGYKAVFEAARDDDRFSSARRTSTAVRACRWSSRRPRSTPSTSRSRSTRPSSASGARSSTRSPRRRRSSAWSAMVKHYVTWFIDQIIESGEADMDDRSSGCRPLVTVDWLGPRRRGVDAGYASAHHAAARGRCPAPESTSRPSRSTSRTCEERTREVIARAAGEPAGRHHQLPRPVRRSTTGR